MSVRCHIHGLSGEMAGLEEVLNKWWFCLYIFTGTNKGGKSQIILGIL